MADGEYAVGDDAPVMIGEWRVDPRADEIASEGRVIKLEPLRMRLLMALARRPGEVVLSQELLDMVWPGVIVTPGSLYQSVAQLRQVLGDSAAEPRYIATVPRKGYRLLAPVRALPTTRPQGDVPPELAVRMPALPDPADAPAAPIAAERPVTPAAPARPGRRYFIAGSIVATAALAAGGAWWWVGRAPAAPIRIAVLPFADHSAGRLDQPLANGITEDIIRTLGRHPALEVVAYDAVTRLQQGAALLAEAATRLDVRYALVGEFWRAGDRVRVATRLVQLPGEKVQQSASYDESMSGLARLPQAIASRTVETLRLTPLALPTEATPTGAYEMYVLGIDAMRSKTPDSIERARRYFTQGIEIDPQYARNYSGLASSWIVQSEVGGRIGTGEAYARAEPLYARALQLDPRLVEARLGLANVARQYQRYDEARRTYAAVIVEHPNNVQAYFGLGLTEETDGWPSRAATQYDRAAALDPTHFLIPIRAGLSILYLGRLAEAEARFRRSIELDGARHNGFYSLAILNWLRGRLDESVVAYRDALKRGEQAGYVWLDYAFVCTDLGLYDEARRALERTARLSESASVASTTAGFVWLADGARPPAPDVLAGNGNPNASLERLLILTMAGERPSATEVNAVDREQAGYPTSTTTLYDVLCGRFRELDMATLFHAAGVVERGNALLDEVERSLNEYEQRGVTAPAFGFHRARILALRGDAVRALTALQTAVDRGWRRAWWMRRDPAFARLRSEEAFGALLRKIDAQLAVQRKTVGG
jgi:DNA-binding winged helix-turn-helix (wHTH) protein/TolB-like protein/Tfp pilus assembly protein PilF